MSYAEILTRVIREQGKLQSDHGPKTVSVCDQETGQFVLISVGWDNRHRVDDIIFHAQLGDGTITIETDMTEEGLTRTLAGAGILLEDIHSVPLRAPQLSDQRLGQMEAEPIAA